MKGHTNHLLTMNLLSHSSVYTEVIDTPEFRRLKDISFLGILGYRSNINKFSTRFEHSLSVANKCYLYAQKKNFSDQSETYFVLAGLLHDLGHCSFSHSLETVFKERFSITHHDITEHLILSSPNLLKLWDKHNIDASRIVDTINGHSHKETKVLAKTCINFDTLDGIARTQRHFSDDNIAEDICNQTYITMCNYENWKDHENAFDSFWNIKESIYSSYIYDSASRFLERIFQELFMKERFLRTDHFFLSDSEIQNEFPWISKFIIDLKSDFSLGFICSQLETRNEFRDMVEMNIRRFKVDLSKDFSVYKNKRYSVSEETLTSYI